MQEARKGRGRLALKGRTAVFESCDLAGAPICGAYDNIQIHCEHDLGAHGNLQSLIEVTVEQKLSGTRHLVTSRGKTCLRELMEAGALQPFPQLRNCFGICDHCHSDNVFGFEELVQEVVVVFRNLVAVGAQHPRLCCCGFQGLSLHHDGSTAVESIECVTVSNEQKL